MKVISYDAVVKAPYIRILPEILYIEQPPKITYKHQVATYN